MELSSPLPSPPSSLSQMVGTRNDPNASRNSFDPHLFDFVRVELSQISLLGSNALEEGSKENASAPPSLLMEIMEIRESLEDCSSMEEAEAIMMETAKAINVCLRGMDEALKAGGGKDDLEDAAVRLQYLHRIEEEARTVMHRIEDAGAKPGVG